MPTLRKVRTDIAIACCVTQQMPIPLIKPDYKTKVIMAGENAHNNLANAMDLHRKSVQKVGQTRTCLIPA